MAKPTLKPGAGSARPRRAKLDPMMRDPDEPDDQTEAGADTDTVDPSEETPEEAVADEAAAGADAADDEDADVEGEDDRAAPALTVRLSGASDTLTRRVASMVPASLNLAQRTIDVVWSTGAPVTRFDWSTGRDYVETLGLDKGQVRLGRLNDGASLLQVHDSSSLRSVVGAVVPGTARIDGAQGIATVKFSKRADADEVFQDVADGIMRAVSVGYLTFKQEIDDTVSPPVYRAIDWEPYEISIVPIGADPNAGFRSFSTTTTTAAATAAAPGAAAPIHREAIMTVQTAAAANPAAPDQDAIRAQILAEERARSAGIRDVATKLRIDPAFAEQHIAAGTSLEGFRAHAIDRAADAETADGATRAQNGSATDSRHGATVPATVRTYVKGTNAARCAIALASSKGSFRDAADIASRLWGPEGAVIARALTTSIGSGGGFIMPDAMSSEVIEFLRPESAVMALGPIIMPMPNGTYTLPRIGQGATGSYNGEFTDAGETEEAFEDVQLQAKKLSGFVPMSKDMLRFPSIEADTVVRDDLIAALAQRADLAFIRGDGSLGTPKGFLTFAQDPRLGGKNYLMAAPRWAAGTSQATIAQQIGTDLGRLRLALINANIKMRKPGWIVSPTTEEFLMNLRDGNGNLVYGNEMAVQKTLKGYPWRRSTLIPSNLSAAYGNGDESEIYLADFSQVFIGEAQGLEINVYDQMTYTDVNGNVINLARRDAIAIMAQVQHDFALRQAFACAVMYGVRWY